MMSLHRDHRPACGALPVPEPMICLDLQGAAAAGLVALGWATDWDAGRLLAVVTATLFVLTADQVS